MYSETSSSWAASYIKGDSRVTNTIEDYIEFKYKLIKDGWRETKKGWLCPYHVKLEKNKKEKK